jgi:hypothetical protein
VMSQPVMSRKQCVRNSIAHNSATKTSAVGLMKIPGNRGRKRQGTHPTHPNPTPVPSTLHSSQSFAYAWLPKRVACYLGTCSGNENSLSLLHNLRFAVVAFRR